MFASHPLQQLNSACPKRHHRLFLESLERRLMLALTIDWVNRGDDGFEDAFEGNAEMARVVVDHVVQAWANVFDDWADYSSDVFEIEINMGLPAVPPPFILPDELYDGCGGFAIPDSQDTILLFGILVPDPADPLFTEGTPDEGRIFLGQCNSGDDWFVDPTPWEHSEFLGPIGNAFYGEAWEETNPVTGLAEVNPADDKVDLYTVVAHELGHALGILPTQDALIGPVFALLNAPFPTPGFQWDDEIGGLLQDTLLPDVADDAGLWTLQSGGFQALYSSANALAAQSPIHVAAPHPGNVVAGGFFGARDMNAETSDGARWLPSLLTATALSSVYGHTLFGLDHFSQYYTQMVRPDLSQPGTLVVRGGSPGDGPIYSDTGNSNDVITLSESGGNLVTQVDLGQDVRGTHTDGLVYTTSVPLTDISSVRVFGFDGVDSGPTGDGDDDVTLDFSTSLWIPAQGITADGGSGDNTLTILGPPGVNNYQLSATEITINGQIISYANFPHIELITGDGNDTITVNISTGLLLSLEIDSAAGEDVIDIEDIPEFTDLEITAGLNDDIVRFTPTAGDLDLLAIGPANIMTVFGGGGDDLVVLADHAEFGDVDFDFNADFLVYPPGEGQIRRGLNQFFVHRDVEEVQVNAGTGNDEFFIRGTPVGSDLTVSGNNGDETFIVATDDILFPTVDRVHSHVAVDGGMGTNTAFLNDLRDTTPPDDQVTVTDTTVGASPGDIYFGLGGSFEYHNLSELTIQVGEEDNTILVESTAEGTDTHIFAGRGSDEIVVTAPSDPGIPVPAKEQQGTVDQIKSLLTIDGELGIDSLFVIDTTDETADKMTLTENTIGRAAASVGPPNPDTFLGPASLGIEYTSISDLTIRMGKGGNAGFVRSTHPLTTTLIETGDGADSFLLRDGATTVNLIRSQLTIDGQIGHDEVYVNDGNEAASSLVAMNGSQVAGDGTYFGPGGELIYLGLELLTVEMGEAGDVALVKETNPGTETVVHTGPTIDQVTVTAVGLTNLVRSPLTIDGDADGAVVLLVNTSDLTSDQVMVTETQVLGNGTYFGAGGSMTYANLAQLALHTGQGNDLINFQSTNAVTAYLADAGPGADAFFVDSNGVAAGGDVGGIASEVIFVGGPGAGNLLILNDGDDVTGDTLTVSPSGPMAGDVGAGPADDFFAPGGTVHYEDISFLFLTAGQGPDVINAAPAPAAVPNTSFVINGNAPTFADPPPGDRLNLSLAGVSNAQLTIDQLGGGALTSSTHGLIDFQNIELVDEPGGGKYDLLLNTNIGPLGGNDGLDDRVEVFAGNESGQKTLTMRLNGPLAFVGIESAINSLTVQGSTDKDTFVVLESPDGLPTLSGSSPAGHTNAPFLASGLSPVHVSIHFDGGTGPELDSLAGVFTSSLNVVKFDDLIAPLKSGVVNVNGVFTMSYGNLEPVSFQAAGGTLTIDATALPGMTQMNVVDLGGGTFEVSGNGGFETTTFNGFSAFVVASPDGAKLLVGSPRRPDCTLVRRSDELSVLGTSRNEQISLLETQRGLFVACGDQTEIGMAGITSLRADVQGGSDQVSARLTTIVDVAVILGDGHDKLRLELEQVLAAAVGQGVHILVQGGSGHDTVEIAAAIGLNPLTDPPKRQRGITPPLIELIAEGGAGNDVLAVDLVLLPALRTGGAGSRDVLDASVHVTLDSGAGNDQATLKVTGQTAELHQRVLMGDGNDELAVSLDGTFGSILWVGDLGAGNDHASLTQRGTFTEATVIQMAGGEGNDKMSVVLDADSSDNHGKVLVELQAGAGNDDLTLLLSDALDELVSALCDGGKGNDRALVSPRVGTINCEKVTVD